jgi:tetratricopeptide (TPR) repeat protein
MGNLAALYWRHGRLLEAAALWRESMEESERYGQHVTARWDYGILTNVNHELGRWDEAVAGADQFLAEVEAGSPHYLAPECLWVRAMIRLGRGDIEAALGDADRGVELARRAKDPQIVYQMLAYAAHVLHEAGEVVRAVSLADEFAGAIEAGESLGFSIVSVQRLAWTLTAVGRGAELAAELEPYTEPWARAGAAFATGDPVRAGEICAEMGAVTQEAYARLAAARMLVDEGRRAEADEHLHRALAFYRSVGATRYVREGESLLAASA